MEFPAFMVIPNPNETHVMMLLYILSEKKEQKKPDDRGYYKCHILSKRKVLVEEPFFGTQRVDPFSGYVQQPEGGFLVGTDYVEGEGRVATNREIEFGKKLLDEWRNKALVLDI